MKRLSTIAELEEVQRPLHLAMGVFDGVHLGHQAVIGTAVEGARGSGGVAGVLTLEPHPIQILAPGQAPRRILVSLEHKERLLASLGVTVLLVLRFDETMARQSAEEFGEHLFSVAALRQMVAGEDWKFGRERRGTIDLLRRLGEPHGVEVTAVPAVMLKGERVSSTRLRRALRDGNLQAASEMLGRSYTVMGTVVRGEQLGRKLGAPTANIMLGDEQLPPDGVYVVTATIGEGKETHRGVANLGMRPTVNGERRLLEVHLLDFEGDLYEAGVEVCFGLRLRSEKKFKDQEELREQIRRDLKEARELFKESKAGI
ncbi:MAG: riboflavin biosynthesis protein RibF [Roseibacillus sp.]|nr:riboflavin biosynthesis protein RibF [Roseibacillus sp.]NRB26577.1 riboflavin biosynthesis protein RibF [Roseibacillus sp.]